MKVAIFFALLGLYNAVKAQKNLTEFNINSLDSLKVIKVTSFYNHIDFIDSRDDKQLGFLDKKRIDTLKAIIPIETQIKTLFHNCVDETSLKDGKILFQLKRLNFSEFIDRELVTKAYCSLGATVYKVRGDKFQKIAFIDTLIVKDYEFLKSSFTKKALKGCYQSISNLISKAVQLCPDSSEYFSLGEVKNIDSIEKSKTQLYSTVKFKDGIYLFFESFKNQIPEHVIEKVKFKKDKLTSVEEFIEGAGGIEINREYTYAVVYQGKPYICTKFGFYPLEKRGIDFFFKGNIADINGGVSQYLIGTILLGRFGGDLLADIATSKASVEIKIDYAKGTFIITKVFED